MRQHSSDSSKSNSTVTTTPGNSQLDYGPILTPTNPHSMRTPLAWQSRENIMNISRPQSRPQSRQPSVHRRSINAHRTHQQQIQAQKQTAAAVIAQLKSTNVGHKHHYNQNSSSSITSKPKPLIHQRSSSSSSITKSLITKQQQLHKQLQQQQQFLRQQMLHRKANNLSNSSSPSVATTSSDDREEVPIVKHCRRTAASRASNNPSMISQLTRHSQLMTIPQSAILTSNSTNREPTSSNVVHCIPTSAYRTNSNATLRSTRSVPAIVFHQQQQAAQQLMHQQQQMLYNHQNANQTNNFNLDHCPVHGTNAINSLTNATTNAVHQNQLLSSQFVNNRPSTAALNFRKFASVNDLSRVVNNLSRSTTAVNFLHTNANNQLMPTIFTVANPHHHLQTPIKSNQITTNTAQQTNEAKLMTTSILPLPMHPAVATPTIYTQPISIATSRTAPVLIPTFTTSQPNHSFAIAKHNKEQLINIVESNQDACCKGHLIVLWIILSVVIIGIVSGIAIGLTI